MARASGESSSSVSSLTVAMWASMQSHSLAYRIWLASRVVVDRAESHKVKF
jgi:hypothetical protein